MSMSINMVQWSLDTNWNEKEEKEKKKKGQQTLSQEFTHPLLFSKHNLRRSPPDMDWTLSAEILLGFSVTWCWLCHVFIRDSEDSDERLDLKKSIQLLLLLLLLPQRREKKKVHSETNKRLMVSVQALVIDDCCSTFCCKSQTPGCDLTAGFFFGRQRRYLLIYDRQRGGAAGYRACLTARKSAVRCRRSRTGVCSLRFSRNLLLQIQLWVESQFPRMHHCWSGLNLIDWPNVNCDFWFKKEV